MPWQLNRVEQEHIEKARALEAAGVELFPPRVQRTHTCQQALAAYAAFESAASTESAAPATSVATTSVAGPSVTVCGRVRRANVKGKLSFMHIEDQSGRIQLFLQINELGAEAYAHISDKLIDTDDFVQATGTLMRTKAGEISVRVQQMRLLSKALSPLPVVKEQVQDDGSVLEFGEFSDTEQRYRQRYADLAVNRSVRNVFVKRAQIVSAVRRYLDELGFLEVETPILQTLYGGAAARPFVTHHNELDQDMYLRISFELYLKRLLVGGYDAVYEIGRDFRNEGVSYRHNPEFTMLEFYKAYIDYHDVMELTEAMLVQVAQQVHGGLHILYQGKVLDFTRPWRRITMRDAIREYAKIDYMDYPTAAQLDAAVRQLDPKLAPNLPWGKLIEHLHGAFVEPNLVNPTIIMDYPRDISPRWATPSPN
jgi:lysyl-tRNA synthetase, class II